MDTYNDDEDDYGDDDDDGGAKARFGDLADEDRLSVNLDDIVDNDSDEEAIDLSKKQSSASTGQAATSTDEETKDGHNSSGSADSE